MGFIARTIRLCSWRLQHCDSLSRNPIAMMVRSEFTEILIQAQQADEHLTAIMEVSKNKPYDYFVLEGNVLHKEENGEWLLVMSGKMQTEKFMKTVIFGWGEKQKIWLKAITGCLN